MREEGRFTKGAGGYGRGQIHACVIRIAQRSATGHDLWTRCHVNSTSAARHCIRNSSFSPNLQNFQSTYFRITVIKLYKRRLRVKLATWQKSYVTISVDLYYIHYYKSFGQNIMQRIVCISRKRETKLQILVLESVTQLQSSQSCEAAMGRLNSSTAIVTQVTSQIRKFWILTSTRLSEAWQTRDWTASSLTSRLHCQRFRRHSV